MRDEYEAKIVKMRSEMRSAHTLETDHINQIYRADIKRIEAYGELRRKEEVAALKALHEAEIRRVVRESERLRRLVSRAGGSMNSNMSLQLERDPVETSDPDPEPTRYAPMPTPRSSLLSPSATQSTPWAVLNESIASQERKEKLAPKVVPDKGGLSPVRRNQILGLEGGTEYSESDPRTTIADMELKLNIIGSSSTIESELIKAIKASEVAALTSIITSPKKEVFVKSTADDSFFNDSIDNTSAAASYDPDAIHLDNLDELMHGWTSEGEVDGIGDEYDRES
jgi:hypothetical protein